MISPGEIVNLKSCNLISWEHFGLYLNSKNSILGLFLAHFPNFLGKKSCSSKKITGQATGWKDGLTLFYSAHPKSTTAADWHLKVKDTEHDVSQTKNYCITVSMQKISSIHKFIFKIQQILGFNELNGHAHNWSHPPKK